MRNNSDKAVFKMGRDFSTIFSVYRKLNDNKKLKSNLVPASEWLLDNFYIIEEHTKQIKRDFSYKVYRDLPLVDSGYTRTFTIARKIVAENDAKIDENIIVNFLNKYEEVTPLYMREIWSLGVCIRMALIEKIREVCDKIGQTYRQWESAEKWLDEYNLNAELKLPDVAENPSFYEHISYKLRRMGKKGIVILNRIDHYIEKYGTSLEIISRKEHSVQAAMKITIGNCIGSLKTISVIDWNELFNLISEIERIFRSEKSGIYAKMDLESKNIYRSRVEWIAKRFKISELHVAKKVLACADENFSDAKCGHIGFYLFTREGMCELLKRLDVKVSFEYLFKENLKQNPFGIYLLTILMFSAISTGLLSWLIFYIYGGFSVWSYVGLFLAFVISFDGGVCFANSQFSKIFKPRIIPRLDFFAGVPNECATMVIVPTLLSSEKRVSEMLSSLETYAAGIDDDNVFYALVGDVREHDLECWEEDENIIKIGEALVNRMNEACGKKKFFFVYRKRFFNASENKWLGWERKRGAILKFNELITTGDRRDYRYISAGFEELPKIKYILTLDADTFVPIHEAKKLIGAMAHPLNQPILNDEKTVVVSGHAIIQPRIGIDTVSANKSKFSQIFAGTGGIDPYVCASSDIYQDLFGEAIFTGKGIYDVDVFQQVLKDTIPDNSILSHDLLEGSYLRAGLATNIELIDGYPARYNAYAMRAHRWARGDWQVLPWLFKRVKNRNGELVKNPIDGISKWKIFDNLRRTLTAPFMILLIFLSFYVLPESPVIWTIFAIILGVRGNRKQFLYQVLFLPFQAALMTNAVFVTLYRVFFAKKNLLEWVTAADMEKKLKNTVGSFYSLMNRSLVIAVFIFLGAYFIKGDTLSIYFALFLFVLWWIAPLTAYSISLPIKNRQESLDSDEIENLREFAKSTWTYFDALMNEENNFLPPDNFQEDPPNGIAYRTSPTNIGLGLLAVISAYDLGFIDLNTMLLKLEKTIHTVEKLDKWNGHLLNWYNTKTLVPLFPRYISTVDSGNFLAYVITSKEALKKILVEESTIDTSLVENMIGKLEKFIDEMNFSILYDNKKNVFSIGYNLEDSRLTNSYYDLLASEARQTSFLAVCRHEVPLKHWFLLGRSLTKMNHEKGLVSWTGTMFEYLMPLLVMRNYPETLLNETYDFVVKSQIEYAKKKGVVWGISESAFYNFDINLNYQYKALGVPWLGLKRGLLEDTVISPYSTMLALMVKPKLAYRNLLALKKLNMLGRYGFYESIDFTPGRLKFLNGDKSYAQVKSYMAHHQGMSLVAINNVINDFVMQKRFHSDVRVRCGEILLQEKVPGDIIYTKSDKEKVVPEKQVNYESVDTDRLIEVNTEILPNYNVLTNGNFFTRVNDRGLGVIRYKNSDLSRYRSNGFAENYGVIFYIRCLNNSQIWSATYKPFLKEPDKYFTLFSGDKAKFVRRDADVETVTEVIVATEDNLDIRRISLVNHGDDVLDFEVTSYVELVTGDQNGDIAHRAFYSLFLNTAMEREVLIAKRRKRSHQDDDFVSYQASFVVGDSFGDFQFETDRMKFLGRYRNTETADVILNGKPLSGTVGAVLDPIFSERRFLRVKPGESGKIIFLTGMENNVDNVFEIVDKYNSEEAVQRAFRLAYARNQVELSYLNVTSDEIREFDDMMRFLI